MANQTAHLFRIENNVLIGTEEEAHKNGLSIGELILKTFQSRPDFIGQVDAITGERTTFRQMRERSVKCALWLQRQNIKLGDVIGICTHNQLNTYVPLFASWYIGAIVNPWSERSVKDNISFYLEQSRPKVVFINDNKAATILEASKETGIFPKIIVFGEKEGFESLDSVLEGQRDEEVDGFTCAQLPNVKKEIAALMFTSGTTGPPKGAKIVHGLFMNPGSHQMPRYISDNVGMWFASLNWITCSILTVSCVIFNVTAIKLAGFESEKVCQLIEKYKVNWVLMESSMCNYLLRSGAIERYDLSSLRQIVNTGSYIVRKTHEALTKLLPCVSITPTYGMTEVGFMTAQQNNSKFGSCGHVCKNMRIIVADSTTGEPLGPNQRGEIRCKTPFLMNGYYKSPETTANVFDSNGWFKTGDIGYYDEDGYIFVMDRIKELIKYQGYHVSPMEIEGLLQKHRAVLEVAVTSVPHPLDSQHPIAIVRKTAGIEVAEAELQQLVAEKLEDWKQLRGGVMFVEKIPRLPSGKIDRQQLRVIAAAWKSESV